MTEKKVIVITGAGSGSGRLTALEHLPYGLDIWHAHKKVLNVEWDDQGGFEVLSNKPGEWEYALLWSIGGCLQGSVTGWLFVGGARGLVG
jgi:hypothetical protein